MSVYHTAFEEKVEPKRNRTEVFLLTGLSRGPSAYRSITRSFCLPAYHEVFLFTGPITRSCLLGLSRGPSVYWPITRSCLLPITRSFCLPAYHEALLLTGIRCYCQHNTPLNCTAGVQRITAYRLWPLSRFINSEGQVSINHTAFEEKGRTEAESNRGPSAYQPN